MAHPTPVFSSTYLNKLAIISRRIYRLLSCCSSVNGLSLGSVDVFNGLRSHMYERSIWAVSVLKSYAHIDNMLPFSFSNCYILLRQRGQYLFVFSQDITLLLWNSWVGLHCLVSFEFSFKGNITSKLIPLFFYFSYFYEPLIINIFKL